MLPQRHVFNNGFVHVKVQITRKLNKHKVIQKQNRNLRTKTKVKRMAMRMMIMMVMMRRVSTVSILLPVVSLSMEMSAKYVIVGKR